MDRVNRYILIRPVVSFFRGEADLVVTPLCGYFCILILFTLVTVGGDRFCPLFFLLCLSALSQ